MTLRSGTSLWVVATIKAEFGWPMSRMIVPFHNREFLLRPETDVHTPSVCIKDENGLTLREGHDLINRLLSALSWAHGAGACVKSVVGWSGEEPIQVGEGTLRHVSEPWRFIYLPQPTDEKALRALAVFREALSLDSPAYRFLGLYKVLNIHFASGQKQKDWINLNLSELKESRAIERLQQLAHEGDIGEYLYHQCRCAVAHAFDLNVVDPDASADAHRLEKDIPLMKELAELMISKIFLVPTDSEFWRLHRNSNELPVECVTTMIEQPQLLP
jgi:hypothetical protein